MVILFGFCVALLIVSVIMQASGLNADLPFAFGVILFVLWVLLGMIDNEEDG